MHLLDGVWLAVKLCCNIMRTVQRLKTAIFLAAYLVLLMASMVAGEASCKYYARMFEAKEMECFLSRNGQYPVCKTGDVSKEHCHIGTRQQHMCIKWPVTTSITCWNNTYWKEMEEEQPHLWMAWDNYPSCLYLSQRHKFSACIFPLTEILLDYIKSTILMKQVFAYRYNIHATFSCTSFISVSDFLLLIILILDCNFSTSLSLCHT